MSVYVQEQVPLFSFANIDGNNDTVTRDVADEAGKENS